VANNDNSGLAGPSRPLGTVDIPQYYLPAGRTSGTYAPRLYGAAVIRFGTRRLRISETRRVAFLVPLGVTTRTVEWEGAIATSVLPDQLLKDAPVAASYLPLPPGAMAIKTFTRWAKRFDRWLARTQRLELPDAGAPGLTESAAAAPTPIGPKRGGVSIELVAIVWELD
jgi:hypothetical protein